MVEVVAIAWVYGLSSLQGDIDFMLGIRISWYWRICWGLLIPLSLSAILIYSLCNNAQLLHEGVAYPNSAIVSGWALSAFALSFLPLCALHAVWKAGKPDTTWKEVSRQHRFMWSLILT
jgi:solute carrier family 6 amino acid transporter-like protein 5/7/9/14